MATAVAVTSGTASAQVRAQPPSPPPQAGAGSASTQAGAPLTIACDECARGEAELDALGDAGAVLRAHADDLVRAWVPLHIEGNSITPIQEARQREQLGAWQQIHEAIRALRDHRDDQVLAIAYALCKSPDADCARYLTGALRLARTIEPGFEDNRYVLPYDPPHTCDPYVDHVRSPKLGFGAEYAAGWQDSAKPVDGAVWSLGLEARARLHDRWGMVARFDRSSGRDAARDDNGDGRDDTDTGRVVRYMMLAGPSYRFASIRDRSATRYWQLDALGGVSRDGERSGFLGGLDLSYQLVGARVGLRALQGVGDAQDERAIVLHTGFLYGAGPQFDYGAGCGQDTRERGSAWALELDIPLSGYATNDGYMTPGFGLEAAWHLHNSFDGLVRADLLVTPNGDRERTLHQAVLAGARMDLHAVNGGLLREMFWTAAAGYDFVSAASSSEVQSGPIAELSVAWGAQASDGAAYLRLHGRFGISPDNEDYRALFLSFGMELRIDRSRWRDRN